ncbi:MAG: hypothetical protein U9Q69_03145 [Nanoarchaeota archaeon]|nr:hypothetical protein [Nanoarchaeota archaeon]
MKKRGQVTLFIVLGIVILAVIGLGFFLRTQIIELITKGEIAESTKAKILTDEIQDYSENCLKKVSKEGLQKICASGGYYNNAKYFVNYNLFRVPYYLYNGQEEIPKIDEVKENLEIYIEENLGHCLKISNLDLEFNNPKIKTIFGKKLKVEVDQKVIFKEEEIVVKINDYAVEIDCNIEELYTRAIDFYDAVKNNSETSFLDQGLLALRQNHKFYTEDINDQEKLFILIFPEWLEEKGLEYGFAVMYPKIESDISAFGTFPEIEFDKIEEISLESVLEVEE